MTPMSAKPQASPQKTTKPLKQEAKATVLTGNQGPVPKKLFLRVPDLEGNAYGKAKNLVDIFEGETQVIFYDSSKQAYVPYGHGIQATKVVLCELQALLGEENVVSK